MIKRVLSLVFCTIITASTGSAEEERPKIGLVLGGGGALGFAHVGVIKELEALQIPIDYIGGTSMGAIVAGMYASGMSPEEMERSFVELDWWDVLKDQSPHQYLVYRRKEDDRRFMGAEFGFNDWSFLFKSGMAYGQKLNNVLETFVLNSTGITDFDQLNIPYRAVATDLRAGESVALGSGSLAQAMRASMAVPGAFTPVRMNGKVFVDGGVLNNIPVDVVKAMGADIIIAVDVGSSSAEKSPETDYRSLGEVVGRTYTLMQRPDQVAQLKKADLVIQPDLVEYSPTHFHKAAGIIPQGRKAVMGLREQLNSYSVAENEYAVFLKIQRLKHEQQILINEIRVEDHSKVSEQTIRYRIQCAEGPLDLNTVNRDLRRIYGMGTFQTVTYELEPSNEEYALIYKATEKYWGPGYLRFGMKFEMATDSSMLWSLLLNYTRTQLNDLGGEVRLDFEGGGHRRGVHSEWYQPIAKSGRFFFAPAITLWDEDIDFYVGDDVLGKVDQQRVFGNFDLGMSGFEFGELRFGIVGGHAWDELKSGVLPLGELDDNVVGLTTRFVLDQLDDAIFPNKGYQLLIKGLFADEGLGSDRTYDRLEGRLVVPFTLGKHTFLPKIMGGTSFGTDLPFYSTFHLGGMDSFAGYAPYQLFGNYYGVMSLGYRYRIGRLPPTFGNGIFAMARADAGNTWMNESDVDINDLNYAGMIGVGADTVIGRCIISIGKAQELSHPRLYFSLGNYF